MAIKVDYTIEAERTLFDILEFIAQGDESAGLRFVAELERRVTGVLGLFPEAGAKTEAGQRVLTIRGYSVVYRFDAGAGVVLVLDIFGPGMDWR